MRSLAASMRICRVRLMSFKLLMDYIRKCRLAGYLALPQTRNIIAESKTIPS